uniref:Integrase_SAM-like_N domain-containing protein n=1 Tax=Steinernema glaseri TaxID=37863 RepID=A0A1I8A0B9_9BILA
MPQPVRVTIRRILGNNKKEEEHKHLGLRTPPIRMGYCRSKRVRYLEKYHPGQCDKGRDTYAQLVFRDILIMCP